MGGHYTNKIVPLLQGSPLSWEILPRVPADPGPPLPLRVRISVRPGLLSRRAYGAHTFIAFGVFSLGRLTMTLLRLYSPPAKSYVPLHKDKSVATKFPMNPIPSFLPQHGNRAGQQRF